MSDHRKRIRRQIKKSINWQKPTVKPTNPQARILAGLNVLSVLDDNTAKYLRDVLHYGPSSFTGKGWAAALIWYRQKGYHGYQTLMLFGIWAVDADDTTRLLIATKPLKFSAPVYNAESYHALIRQSFKTYYADDGSPPSEDYIIYETTFDPTRRLKLREELATEMIQWLRLRNC